METPKTVLEPVLVAHQWCHSVSQLIRFEFQWTIHHFKLQHSGSQTMKSTVFSLKEHPDLKWQLIVTSRVFEYSGDCYDISVSNQPNDQIGSKHSLKQNTRFKIAILNKKGKKDAVFDVMKEHGETMPLSLKLISYSALRSPSNDWLSENGHLTIHCEIETVVPKEHVSSTAFTSGSTSTLAFSRSKDQFEKLFESTNFNDVITLAVSGRQFHAHKSILSARSPVFAAMFEHPTKEKMLNEVVVSNIEPDVFQEVLRYTYTGRVPSNRMEEMALELFIAADRYLLEELKEECEQRLINGLSTENCVELFSLADRHSAGTLKQKALDFVRLFPEEVLRTMTIDGKDQLRLNGSV